MGLSRIFEMLMNDLAGSNTNKNYVRPQNKFNFYSTFVVIIRGRAF